MNKKMRGNSCITYFYRNAIRMGETNVHRPIGTSITLYHNGLNAILSHNQNSQFHGHCIFYKSRCLISVGYIRNRVSDIAYRTDGYLLYLNYNGQSKLNEQSFLMCFTNRVLYSIKYQNGIMKTRKKLSVIHNVQVDDIFFNNNFALVIGQKHAKAIEHQQLNINNIKIIKKGNKAEIFYSNNPSAHLLTGLGFIFIFRSPEHGGYDPDKNKYGDEFQLQFVEKGSYKNQLLDGYGQKTFKNNNFYEGFFVKNSFQGEGILRDAKKGNWVYGIFQENKLKDMLDYSNQNGDQTAKMNIILEKIRQKEKFYINSLFDEPEFSFLDKEIQKILSLQNYEIMNIPTLQQKKQMILDTITKSYIDPKTPKASDKPLHQTMKIDLKKSQVPATRVIKSLLSTNISPRQYAIRKGNSIQQNNSSRSNQILRENTPQRTKSGAQTDRAMKIVSRIFKKDYSHLGSQTQREKPVDSFLKLQKVQNSQYSPNKSINQRLRKSVIFTNSKSGKKYNLNENEDLIKSLSPLYRRSPRKTTIFETSLKLKDPFDEQNDGTLSLRKLSSIRKASGQKKSLLKTQKVQKKGASKNIIFEKNKEKDFDSKIFNYT